MSIIIQKVFQGMIPIISSRLLPENKSELAINCKFYSGNLLPFKTPLKDYDVQAGTDSIYQYRNGVNKYWFEWGTDVDVIESPIASDANNRVYYSGSPQGLRWTDNAQALASLPYPAADSTLVFNPPTDAPVLVAGTPPGGADPTTAETRSYVYTFVTNDGWESSPSPLSTVDEIYPTQDVNITILSDPGIVDLNITQTRLYRTTPAGAWQFVIQQPIGQTAITDNVATDQLGELLQTTTWLPADNDLKGLIVNDSGSGVAFKNNELWLSEPYILYGWPLAYRLSVATDIVAIKASAQSIYIATKRNPYVAMGISAGEYQLIKIDEDLPCVSKRSMVDAGEKAFYASTNGIVMFEGNTARLITNQIIQADQWQADFDPDNLIGVWFEDKIFYFSPTVAFIFDPNDGDIVELGVIVSAVYNSLETNTLYILVGTEIFAWDSTTGTFMSYEYHGKDSIYSPTWFSAAQVNAESYNDLQFELYRDGIMVHSKVVSNNAPFRLPTERGRKYSYNLKGSDEVRGVFLASTMSELTGV